MKTLILILAVVLISLPSYTWAGGKCVGDDPCKACSNCSNCKHCKSGGTCGACAVKETKKSKQAKKAEEKPEVIAEEFKGKKCGTWRWDVKTLSDPGKNWVRSRDTVTFTFEDLLKTDTVILSQGGNPIIPRKPDEFFVKVSGKILKYKLEDDDDYHVVLTDGRYFIVCEIPSPFCDGAAQSGYGVKYAAARKVVESLPGKKQKGWFEVDQNGSTYTFTGVLFHDFKHGARFTMPNCLEIHPVINIIKD